MVTNCINSNREMILSVLERELKEQRKAGVSPHFSCQVGSYTLHRDGRISSDTQDNGIFTTLAFLGLCDYPYATAPPEDGEILYPMDAHTGTSLLNLFRILSARQHLLNRVLDAKDAFFVDPMLMRQLLAHPPVTVPDFLQALYGRQEAYRGVYVCPEYIAFPGFRKGKPEEIAFHCQLADHLISAALSKSWAKAFTPNLRNKKYVCRMWLNELGMSGPEYEELRAALLSRLPGRSGQKQIPRKKATARGLSPQRKQVGSMPSAADAAAGGRAE